LPKWEKVRCPTLAVWGENDPFLLEPQIEGSGPFVDAPWRYEKIKGAGHWLMLDQPEVLNRFLLEFLG
jgi:pimeloyl-ACP methyl ester carboxylesterase